MQLAREDKPTGFSVLFQNVGSVILGLRTVHMADAALSDRSMTPIEPSTIFSVMDDILETRKSATIYSALLFATTRVWKYWFGTCFLAGYSITIRISRWQFASYENSSRNGASLNSLLQTCSNLKDWRLISITWWAFLRKFLISSSSPIRNSRRWWSEISYAANFYFRNWNISGDWLRCEY